MTFHTSRTHITVFTLLIILVIVTITAVTGARDVGVGPSYVKLPSMVTSQERKCEESYGFLPCTTTRLGNGFLIIVYGYIMYTGATYLSNGSELLLEVLGPGIIGGLFLPVLGALPDAMLILVSGLSGTAATAQDQVSVGMGLLAGSTVMLLTVIWGTCVIVGKCDLRNSLAIDETDTKGFNLLESGVSTDIWTSYAARIMAISVLPFLVVQLPQALHSTSGRHLAVLFALILSLLMLISYCVYQVFQPWIQVRRLNYVKHKRVLTRFLKHLKANAFMKLYNDDATPNIEAIEKIFEAIDVDKDGHLSEGELRAFVVGIEFEEMNLKQDDFARSLLKEFDTERQDDNIDLEEFKKGIIRLLGNVRGGRPSLRISETEKYIQQYDEEAREEHLLLGDEDEDESEEVENPKGTTIKAVLLLVLGTLIAAVFADPLVDAVDNFSDATSIPSFFISFIALPLATNSSEAVSSIIFASRKKRRSTSLTFSEIYGSVTMNNVLCLAVFLALVYVRGLTWDFSSEVLVIFLVCIIMGAIGSFRTTFPLWMSYLAFLFYPLSLVLVYVLDYVFGWS